jgi:hypothetical protein
MTDKLEAAVEKAATDMEQRLVKGTLYEGEPDARQGDDPPQSRFRQRYRRLTDEEIELHDTIKRKAVELEKLIYQAGDNPHGETSAVWERHRYRSLAMTALEQSIMWSIKGLTL